MRITDENRLWPPLNQQLTNRSVRVFIPIGTKGFNHAQFCGPASVDGQVEDANYGRIVSASAPPTAATRCQVPFLIRNVRLEDGPRTRATRLYVSSRSPQLLARVGASLGLPQPHRRMLRWLPLGSKNNSDGPRAKLTPWTQHDTY